MKKYLLGNSLKILPKLSIKFNLILTSVPDLSELKMDNETDYKDFLYRIFFDLGRLINPNGFLVFCQTDKKHKGRILLKHKIIIDYFINNGFILKDYKINLRNEIGKIDLYQLNFQHVCP